jgi:hypothetical protein
MSTNNKPNKISGLIILRNGKPHRWMLLILMLAFVNGAWAQTNTDPTQAVCIGNEPYLVTPTSGSTYLWTITSGSQGTDWRINGTGATISVDWITPGIYTLSVTETNAQGCRGQEKSVSVTVTTVQVPLLTASVSPVCFGTTGVVYTTDPGKSNYVWVVTGGIITTGGTSADNSVTVTWNGSAPHSVSVNYTNPTGCSTGSPTILDVEVIALPVTSPIYHN